MAAPDPHAAKVLRFFWLLVRSASSTIFTTILELPFALALYSWWWLKERWTSA